MNGRDHISACLTALGLKHHAVGEDAVVVPFAGEHTQYSLFITAGHLVVTLVGQSNVIVPEHRLTEARELANAINADWLNVGAFWVDPAHRYLAWEYSMLAVEPITPELLLLARLAARAVDRFFPAFAQVIWAGATTHDALASIKAGASSEMPSHEDDEPGRQIAV